MYEFYISRNGVLEREGNTIYFKGEDFKTHIPVNNISEIIIAAKVGLSSWAIDYLSKLNIPVHVLTENGNYLASLFPIGKNGAGMDTVKQALAYSDTGQRTRIAKEMVMGIRASILRNLRYYNRGSLLDDVIERVRSYRPAGETVDSIMGYEGNIWNAYYSAFPKMFRDYPSFRRSFHPPTDHLNAMISFGNALLYSSTLTKIVTSGMNPAISFLHEPSDRSFSLALDIADVFKPVIVERIIGNLANNRILGGSDFRVDDEACYLSEKGRKKFLEYYSEKINTSVKTERGYVTYGTLIKEECIKLLKDIRGEEKYRSFRSWD